MDAKRNEKLLEILKRCPFVLETINNNVHSEEYNKRYEWGTITDDELALVKEWLFDETKQRNE